MKRVAAVPGPLRFPLSLWLLCTLPSAIRKRNQGVLRAAVRDHAPTWTLMNFFGHAVVATWHSDEPAFVLGAMLPDFATMIGERVPSVVHSVIESGVAFHHATDRVFHDAPTFRALELDARRSLRALGVSRPSALAVAHIGVEMILDVSLADDERGAQAYATALHEGRTEALGVHIRWASEAGSDRYETLRALISARGVPRAALDAASITFRVARALSSRPRLRLEPGADAVVERWVTDAAFRIAEAAPALMGEVTRGLDLGTKELPPRLVFR